MAKLEGKEVAEDEQAKYDTRHPAIQTNKVRDMDLKTLVWHR